MCTSMGIMDKGRLLKSGTIESILNARPHSTLYLNVIAGEETLVSMLEQSPLVSQVVKKDSAFVVDFTGDIEDEAELLKALVLADVGVTSFRKVAASMEDTLIELVSPDEGADDDAATAGPENFDSAESIESKEALNND